MRATQGEDGATAVEYALLASLIAVAIAVTAAALGGTVTGLFQSVVDAWP